MLEFMQARGRQIFYGTPLKTFFNRLWPKSRASTKGRNLASVPVRRFLRPIFIRVHFVLRPVRSYILAIFWYFLGPSNDKNMP